ncbi:hypothetical protein FOZ63_033732 [Perkinsus olseni]|uniref:Tyr recombinase domain-containing protein n=1 Tax=Perkinsus olseni TaxID=32597 RepID=A0A7J6T163_PEROL|nr:hypothetical protein FOZ62_031034 [Perkinsus olseni]KAF4751707.1 hypothetical protein FOZ63_033732 [Perkinsus olseni]
MYSLLSPVWSVVGKTESAWVAMGPIRTSLQWILAFLLFAAARSSERLSSFGFRRLFDVRFRRPSLSAAIVVDASTTGYGGILVLDGKLARWFSEKVSDDDLRKFSASRGNSKFQALWESLAILIASRLWKNRLPSTVGIVCQSDSRTALGAALRLRSRSPTINAVVRELALDAAVDVRVLHVLYEHVPSKLNYLADSLSRRFEGSLESAVPSELGGVPRDFCAARDDSFWRLSLMSPRPGRKLSKAEEAVRTARSPTRLGMAMKALEDDVYAPSSKAPRRSRQRLWQKLTLALGHDEMPLTVRSIEEVAAVLKHCHYRSAYAYIQQAAATSAAAGYPLGVAEKQAMKRAKRACARGIGPAKQVRPLTAAQLAAMMRNATGTMSKLRAVAYVVGAWFMLRVSELVEVRIGDAEIDAVAGRVTLHIPQSKTDQQSIGGYRSHSCTCAMGNSGAMLCPVHAIELATRWMQDAGYQGGAHLFACGDGRPWTKGDCLKCLRSDLQGIGATDNDKYHWGTHSMRRDGCWLLVGAGLTREEVQVFGRWRSAAVDLYIQEAMIQTYGDTYACRALAAAAVGPRCDSPADAVADESERSYRSEDIAYPDPNDDRFTQGYVIVETGSDLVMTTTSTCSTGDGDQRHGEAEKSCWWSRQPAATDPCKIWLRE